MIISNLVKVITKMRRHTNKYMSRKESVSGIKFGISKLVQGKDDIVRDGHGGGWSRKINARYLHTLMVYL